MKTTIVLTYTFTPAWLALSREERNAMAATHIQPVFAKYADRVPARFFDAEAFTTAFSDFALLETEDLQAYYFLIEELRDSPLIAQGYLVMNDIFMGIEAGFHAFEAQTGAGGREVPRG
ncbi:darcynin family protein [Streptomyces sp. NPDC007205]|uniref:darcynin family protein n=1 Tax=Streptomyces sp. NPDC007205 TaxID=3154316 RepID=UPI0033C0F646